MRASAVWCIVRNHAVFVFIFWSIVTAITAVAGSIASAITGSITGSITISVAVTAVASKAGCVSAIFRRLAIIRRVARALLAAV